MEPQLTALERIAVVETKVDSLTVTVNEVRDIAKSLQADRIERQARWGVFKGSTRYVPWVFALATGYMGSKLDSITHWLYAAPR